MVNRSTTCKIKNYLDFSMIALPSAVKCLIFEEEFIGEPPALNDFTNLEELVIKVPIFWSYVSALKNPHLKSLSLVIDDTGQVERIRHDSLESLSIYNISKKNLTPIERIISSSILTGYDFSGMPKLKSLSLDYFLGFDFNKTILPKSLESLEINHSEIQNVDWCLTVKTLKSLSLEYNSISDIKLLSYMPYLSHISLRGNDIRDAYALADIEGLKYLNLLDNPLSSADRLRAVIRADSLLLNQRDAELYAIKAQAYALKEQTEEFIQAYDRYAPNRSAFVQMQNLKEQEHGAEKRLISYYQLEFEYGLDKINPFDYEYEGYSSEYKRLFAEYAGQANSLLLIKDRINKKLYYEVELEKKGLGNMFPAQAGCITFSCEAGLFRINTRKASGSGKLYFNPNQISERLSGVLIRAIILNACKSSLKDEIIAYDYDIDIHSIYGTKADGSIGLGIMISIFSAINNVNIDSSYIFYGQFNTRGSLKKINISRSLLLLFQRLGAKKLIIGKITQKAMLGIANLSGNQPEYICCNSLNDILKNLQASDYSENKIN